MFHNVNIKNRGIAGNTTNDLLKRTSITIACHPKTIFIMADINDIFYSDITKQHTLDNLNQIVALIKRVSPTTKIYIQSILPVTDVNITKLVAIYNEDLKNSCEKTK